MVRTKWVRDADRHEGPTSDGLDAARTLVPLGSAGLSGGGPGGFQRNAEGFLKSGKQMHELADEICHLAGLSSDPAREARELLARTRSTAEWCALDPRPALGLGAPHLPDCHIGRDHGYPPV